MYFNFNGSGKMINYEDMRLKQRSAIFCLTGIALIFLCVLFFVNPVNGVTIDEIKNQPIIYSPIQNLINNTYYYNSTINESYIVATGKIGGQILTGGTQANEDLILNGTSSPTKTTSYVILQNGGGGVNFNTSSGNNGAISLDGNIIFSTNNNQNEIYMPFSGQRFRVGAYTTFSQTAIDYATIIGNNIAASRIQAGNISKLSSAGDSGQYIASKWSRGVWIGTGLGKGDSVGTEYYATQNMRLVVNLSGFVGIGTSSPTEQLHTTGGVRFASLGAGTVMADASGKLYIISDEKFKTDIKPYSISAIAAIQKIIPITNKFKPESGLDTINTYTGFSAQNLETAIPSAVYAKQDVKYEQKLIKGEYEVIEVPIVGSYTKSISDRAIIATLILGIQEQQKQIDTLNERLNKLEGK